MRWNRLQVNAMSSLIAHPQENQQTNDSFVSAAALTDAGTKYLPANFKKKGGFLRSTQLSAEYGLWRQDYCGCVYSQRV